MDDDFPCCEQDGRLVPAFTHSSSTSEIWVMVAEKAWAKLHGSYAKYGVANVISQLNLVED